MKTKTDLTYEELEELTQTDEEVWVVYEYDGVMQKCPAKIFVSDYDRSGRKFYTNYWLALGQFIRFQVKWQS